MRNERSIEEEPSDGSCLDFVEQEEKNERKRARNEYVRKYGKDLGRAFFDFSENCWMDEDDKNAVRKREKFIFELTKALGSGDLEERTRAVRVIVTMLEDHKNQISDLRPRRVTSRIS